MALPDTLSRLRLPVIGAPLFIISNPKLVVAQCKANRLICVLEVHDTTGYGEDAAAGTLDQAADYWIGLKSVLAGQENYVIINIGNEPWGNTDPAGWTVFTIKVEGETAPAAQFLWELLLEVAQVAVHDPDGDGKLDIEEGKARPVFELHKVSIGLTAEQMIAEIRPNLQAQAEFIAKTILGKFWKHNDHLDFYYRRGADGGAPILFFVAPSDPRPGPASTGR